MRSTLNKSHHQLAPFAGLSHVAEVDSSGGSCLAVSKRLEPRETLRYMALDANRYIYRDLPVTLEHDSMARVEKSMLACSNDAEIGSEFEIPICELSLSI